MKVVSCLRIIVSVSIIFNFQFFLFNSATAQTDWKKVQKLLDDGSYKSAFGEAEKIYKTTRNSSDLLTAAWYMNEAAGWYQEDASDSSEARYRSILPRLEAPERAVCYALLGVSDSALLDEELLKQTSSERIRRFCENTKGKGINVTPTVFDVVSWHLLKNYADNKDQLLQKLIEFHSADSDDVRIWLDEKMLDFLVGKPNQTRQEELYKAYIEKYRASTCARRTCFYYHMAHYYYYHQDNPKDAILYCDSAIAIAPKSEGGADAANLRSYITRTYITLNASFSNDRAIPGRPSLHLLSYRNVGHLYLGLAPYKEDANGIVMIPNDLRRWELDVDTSDRYHLRSILFDVPAIEAGRWLLVVSEDKVFDKEDALLEIKCTDMKIMAMSGRDIFRLVAASSGEPICGQQVEFYIRKNGLYELISSTQTDSDGRFRYEGRGRSRYWIKIVRDGYEYFEDIWTGRREEEPGMQTYLRLTQDRPVYLPGDTIHVAAVFYESDGLDGRTIPGEQIKIELVDPNYEARDTLSVTTDDFGVASATFVISKDALAGTWMLKASGGDTPAYLHFPVEEYKQPKFMVSIDAAANSDIQTPSSALAFGTPYTVSGLAQAYSGAKVSGAKVKYTVTRHTSYWRWNRYVPDKVILSDSTVTAADGSFLVTFTPMPDSSVELSYKPNFRYEIFAEVTDLNGETHSASTSITVGYHNITLTLRTQNPELRTLENVSVSLSDINGRPMAGDVTLTLSRLHIPDTALLIPPVMEADGRARNILSPEHFRQLFPSYVYSRAETDRNRLASDWDWQTTQHLTSDELQHKVSLPELQSGYYRIVANCGEETDTQYVRLTLPDERRIQSADLLWADVSNTSVHPGDRVTLRYASAFDGVRFFYVLAEADGKERDIRWIPAGRKIKSLSIPVDSAMLGGFTVNLFAVKDGVTTSWQQRISVPFTHKQLKVDIATFRDKLQPGEQEEWTIKVKGANADTVNSQLSTLNAQLILTLFDDALSTYGYGFQSWSINPWRYGSSYNTRWLSTYGYSSSYASTYKAVRGSDPAIVCWQLYYDEPVLYCLSTARGESKMVAMQEGNVRKRAGVVVEEEEVLYEVAVADEAVPMSGNSADKVVASVGGIGYSDGGEELLEMEESLGNLTDPESLQLRSNLSTLAFFVADLRTDSTGTAVYRFHVPELLTRWRLRGMAFTTDLKVGTLDRTLVTQKPLMVQPNIPRFLRHGDSLVLMAKVMNLTDDDRRVRVSFTLKESSSNSVVGDLIADTVTIPAQGSAQVTFPIADLPVDLYVATYEIIAQTIDGNDLPHYSDGERGEIPVVSSRQAVTLSQPLYINGKGEKTFHLPLSAFHSSATAEPHLLAAELTTDPIWLAVKSMPYLKEQENPSTLYLANSLYVNTLAYNILKSLKDIKNLENIEDTANTRLSINEDVKQTLLEATPWLRDAQSEVELRQAIANYFDSATLNTQFSTLNSQLTERQNADGGWSWMPEGESSVWITMQVLKRLAPCDAVSSQQDKALSYVDREEQRYYEKYIKPYLKKYKWQPDNIEYLYTRSFYGKGKTEAYKFYYKNALKNYKSYNGLYTQAQLALIFQRHGDKKAARDLIRRLKEKSLVSDEMGMFWRDNRSGWCWYERPVETQALLIQAFREVTPQDTLSIALMQQWLLKQKQTTHWGNDRATVEAISALMPQVTRNTQDTPISLTVLGAPLTALSEGLEGYRSQRWTGAELDTLLTHDSELITIKKETPGIAWGAIYFQYTDNMDKIPSSESGITLKRTYLDRNNQNILNTQNTPKVGDRIKVRIEISVDRNMEYLELIDGRPSCVEPLSTRSGWNWNQGLRYYVEVKNTATHCYINRLEKGKYVVEYEVYVTNPGSFLAGPVTMQCMYAPEFRATSPAQRLTVE